MNNFKSCPCYPSTPQHKYLFTALQGIAPLLVGRYRMAPHFQGAQLLQFSTKWSRTVKNQLHKISPFAIYILYRLSKLRFSAKTVSTKCLKLPICEKLCTSKIWHYMVFLVATQQDNNYILSGPEILANCSHVVSLRVHNHYSCRKKQLLLL